MRDPSYLDVHLSPIGDPLLGEIGVHVWAVRLHEWISDLFFSPILLFSVYEDSQWLHFCSGRCPFRRLARNECQCVALVHELTSFFFFFSYCTVWPWLDLTGHGTSHGREDLVPYNSCQVMAQVMAEKILSPTILARSWHKSWQRRSCPLQFLPGHGTSHGREDLVPYNSCQVMAQVMAEKILSPTILATASCVITCLPSTRSLKYWEKFQFGFRLFLNRLTFVWTNGLIRSWGSLEKCRKEGGVELWSWEAWKENTRERERERERDVELLSRGAWRENTKETERERERERDVELLSRGAWRENTKETERERERCGTFWVVAFFCYRAHVCDFSPSLLMTACLVSLINLMCSHQCGFREHFLAVLAVSRAGWDCLPSGSMWFLWAFSGRSCSE